MIAPPSQADYKMRIKSADGTLLAEVTDFLELAYVKKVNQPGLATAILDGDHAVVSLLEHKSQIEVWRRNLAHEIDWYCDFYGLFLDDDRKYTDHGLFTMRCPGQMWFLSTRIVAWYADTADRSAFTSEKAETIMKTLVSYNAGASATTGNGRIRTGTITGISVEADGANGNTLDWYCAWENLLETLQKLTRVAGGDFDLIKTGAQAWEFRWYTGQRGSDRSTTVIFALERGNMASPQCRRNRIDERTVAIVGGQGTAGDREVVTRTGDDYSASNDVEVFVQANASGSTSALNATGDAKLDELRSRQTFTFDVLQTPSCLYGKHYCVDGALGDLATARYQDVEETVKIAMVTVSVKPTGEEVIEPIAEAV